MSKTQQNYKFKLLKQEEEEIKETHCIKNWPRAIFLSVAFCLAAIGAIIFLYCLKREYYPSYSIEVVQNNRTGYMLQLYGGPRSTETVIGFQSQNNYSINDFEQIHENKCSQNKKANFSYQHNYLNYNSSTSALLKIIENKLIKTKVEQPYYNNKTGGIEQEVASHRITEDGEKLKVNNNLFNQSKYILSNNYVLSLYILLCAVFVFVIFMIVFYITFSRQDTLRVTNIKMEENHSERFTFALTRPNCYRAIM